MKEQNIILNGSLSIDLNGDEIKVTATFIIRLKQIGQEECMQKKCHVEHQYLSDKEERMLEHQGRAGVS